MDVIYIQKVINESEKKNDMQEIKMDLKFSILILLETRDFNLSQSSITNGGR